MLKDKRDRVRDESKKMGNNVRGCKGKKCVWGGDHDGPSSQAIVSGTVDNCVHVDSDSDAVSINNIY